MPGSFRFRLQPALERAAAQERETRLAVLRARAAHVAAVDAAAAVGARVGAIIALENRIARAGSPRVLETLADSDACIGALRLELRRRQASAAKLEGPFAEARHAYAGAARRHAALARLRARVLAGARARAELDEANELDEVNALQGARRRVSLSGMSGS